MKYFSSPNFQLCIFFLILIAISCSPVWSVEYFVNQDGSGHLYSSFLMLENLKAGSPFTDFFGFNSFSVPNSSGHWLLVLLLTIFQPFIITKIIVTLTFAGFVASIGWLRLKTAGREGLKTSLLIGAAIGFNWLWFLGFYNFIIGVIFFSFTIGLTYKWRETLNWQRTILLSLLFLTVYFSHIVSFLILAGSVFLIILSATNANLKKNILLIFAALLPVLPLILIFKSISAGGGFSPVWRSLNDPFSVASWFNQIRSADSFIIISRKDFPFFVKSSSFFLIFAPILWITLAILSLSIGTFVERTKSLLSKNYLVFIFLFFGCVFLALFAPDDFGLNNGSILRERLLICGIIFFIPLFQFEKALKYKRFAQICLIFVILFQTAAVWDYSLQTTREAKEFMTAKDYISENDSIASIVFLESEERFHSAPVTQMSNYLGLSKNVMVWDNYEAGHYLFPIIATNPADKQFVFDWTTSNVFVANLPNDLLDQKLNTLDSTLAVNNRKINVLVVWGGNEKVERVLNKWFEPQPFFENGHIRLFRHRTYLF